jgi:hypothetical protein
VIIFPSLPNKTMNHFLVNGVPPPLNSAWDNLLIYKQLVVNGEIIVPHLEVEDLVAESLESKTINLLTANGLRVLGTSVLRTLSTSLYLGQNAGPSATGLLNCFVGANAGQDWTSGAGNTIVGANAARNCATGLTNIVIGTDAANNLNGGDSNTVLGYNTQLANPGNGYSIILSAQGITDPPLVGAGSNTFCVPSYNIAQQPATDSVLGYINASHQVVRATTIGPTMTFTNGTSAPTAGPGYFYTGTMDNGAGGASPQTVNSRVGHVKFTGLENIVAGGLSVGSILENNRIPGALGEAHAMFTIADHSNPNGATLVIHECPAGNGSAAFRFRNVSAVDTGTPNDVTVAFIIFD